MLNNLQQQHLHYLREAMVSSGLLSSLLTIHVLSFFVFSNGISSMLATKWCQVITVRTPPHLVFVLAEAVFDHLRVDTR